MARYSRGFQGNLNVRSAGVPIEWTPEKVEIFARCSQDPLYFIRHYVYIKNVDSEELILFEPRDYQKEMLQKMIEERFVIVKLPRQAGKTVIVSAILLWHVIFNRNFGILCAAHKGDKARDVLAMIKGMYENLPEFLQHGVVEWNKGRIELENGSLIRASATSGSSARGDTVNMIYIDEAAFIASHVAEDFFKSVIPTISSGKTTKTFITSTPKGLNHFYEMWVAATHPDPDKRSGYAYVEIKWDDVPGRDEKFRKQVVAQFGQEYFDQEYGAEFLGSSRTLISGAKLVSMANHIIQPIEQNQTTRIYKKAQKGHSYAMTVDVSEGLGGDYSAIVVFDITELPYEIVAVFKTNEMHPMALPGVIFDMAQTYNEPLVLVEANFGQQVGEILYSDLEYENVVFTTKGKTGPQAKVDRISAGFGNRNRVGIAWSKNSKRVGCTNLKTLIEQDQLFVPCSWIYEELKRFVVVKESYAGEDGHDDLAMCLVMFGWMCDQGYVRDATDVHLRGKIKDLNQALIEEEMFPLGWTVRAGEADEGFEPIHIVRPPAIDIPNLESGEPHPWNDLFNQARSRGGMTEAQLHDKFIMELFNQGPPRPSDE